MKKTLILAALAASAAAFGQQTFNYAGPIGSIDAPGSATNVTLTAASTAAYNVGSFRFNTATLTEIQTNTFASEARIRVRNSGYTGTNDFVDLQPFTLGNYTGSTSLASPVTLGPGFFDNKLISASSTWSFEFFEFVQDGPAGASEQDWTGLNFETFVHGTVTPPTATDLGTLTDSSATYATPDYTFNATAPASGIAWYKFNLSGALASPNFLDFDTDVAGVANGTDSEIALYAADGTLISQDDDDGPGFYSALSFGDVGPRGPIGNGVAANGRDGATLAAGTYYLGVGAFNSTFGSDFLVTSTATVARDFTVNIRTNVVGAPVPEPASLAALGLGAAALLRRRRRS